MNNKRIFRAGLWALTVLSLAGLATAAEMKPAEPAGPVLNVVSNPPVAVAPPAGFETNQFPVIHPLAPGAGDGRISQVTATLLERAQYLRQPFDDVVSSNFLDRLIKELDPQHIHFLKSDIKEFDQHRFDLDDLTLKKGDTSPAYEIFNRFVQRLEQRVAYSSELLRTEKFEFINDDRVLLNRKDQPFPVDLTAAKQLWRERVRFDYLQEKLNLPATNTVAKTGETSTNSLPRTPEQIRAEIARTLIRRYTRTLKMFADWDSDNVLQFYLDTLTHVYDPHSDYMGKAAMEEFSIQMNLSLFGIGALLTTEDGYCKIKELMPGPAMKDGRIKNNDRIVAVAQGTNEPVDVVDMPLNKVVQFIRGPKGTEVRLTVIPANATDSSVRKIVPLVRDEIKLEDKEAKAKIIEPPQGKSGGLRLGVIDLPSFYSTIESGKELASDGSAPARRSTTDDVSKLLKKLEAEKVDGVILDLRGNGGGSLQEAIRLTGLFIRRGTVVQVRDPNGIVMPDDDEDPEVLYDGPLMVMTDRFSASASEILAGALQDYGRALIVGDSATHGKGTVQSLVQLAQVNGAPPHDGSWATNDPGAIKLTIRKFYRPSGSSTQLKGVIPDIVLPSVNNVADLGETSLDNPMPWDTIEAAPIKPVNRVEPCLRELRNRSARRVAEEKDFAYVREDMELYKKAQADKTVSLNEKQRLKEKQEAEARDEVRKKEREARPAVAEKLYELTLKQADLPGLPAPVAATNATAKAGAPGVAKDSLELPDADQDHKAPAVDVDLNEAEHILTDYISLFPREAVAVNTR